MGDIHRSEKSNLLTELFPVVREAGAAIMQVYEQGVEATLKGDGSPVTAADQRAEDIILSALKKIAPDIPIISEENSASHSMLAPNRFFLVDPLDGTREFIKHDDKGCFTVNIALIEEGQPVLGVVFAPALERMFAGVVGEGAVESNKDSKGGMSPVIQVRDVPAIGPTAIASVSHRDAQTNQWLEDHDILKVAAIGSSLKFCLIACGEADVYPRFGPTMEWDTAAGDAILRAAGGSVFHLDGAPFRYGKADYRNDAFIATGKFTAF